MTAAVGDRYLDRRERGRRLSIVTPEGVPLGFSIALAGDRLGGFILDWLLSHAIMLVLFIGLLIITGGEPGMLMAFLLIAVFVLENFYFIFFEIRWQGMTPGKKAVGIRVISSDGGPITTDAIVVRNLTRVIEVQLPLAVLLQPLFSPVPGWMTLIASVWALTLAGMPLFNRHRLRIGDMVAGTIVVLRPRSVLLKDLGGKAERRSAKFGSIFRFTDEQMAVYGIYELQVLEELLRHEHTDRRDAMRVVGRKIRKKIRWPFPVEPRDEQRFLEEFYAALRAVATSIRKKIGWKDVIDPLHASEFLRAFYAAQRDHLERRMLLGEKKERKDT